MQHSLMQRNFTAETYTRRKLYETFRIKFSIRFLGVPVPSKSSMSESSRKPFPKTYSNVWYVIYTIYAVIQGRVAGFGFKFSSL